MDYIFEANNSVLVAAAATGLKQSPGATTNQMTIEDEDGKAENGWSAVVISGDPKLALRRGVSLSGMRRACSSPTTHMEVERRS